MNGYEATAADVEVVGPDKDLIDATIALSALYAGLPASDELRPVLREAIVALVYPRIRLVAVAASGTDAT